VLPFTRQGTSLSHAWRACDIRRQSVALILRERPQLSQVSSGLGFLITAFFGQPRA
jgi:hypothetical protein